MDVHTGGDLWTFTWAEQTIKCVTWLPVSAPQGCQLVVVAAARRNEEDSHCNMTVLTVSAPAGQNSAACMTARYTFCLHLPEPTSYNADWAMTHVSLSPDGSHIAVFHPQGASMAVHAFGSGETQQITMRCGPALLHCEAVAWAADGDSLAVMDTEIQHVKESRYGWHASPRISIMQLHTGKGKLHRLGGGPAFEPTAEHKSAYEAQQAGERLSLGNSSANSASLTYFSKIRLPSKVGDPWPPTDDYKVVRLDFNGMPLGQD